MKPLFAVTLAGALAWSCYYAYSRLANNSRKMRLSLQTIAWVRHPVKTWRDAAHYPPLSDIEVRLGD